MKLSIRSFVPILSLLVAISASQAIEDLKITVNSTNAVVSWPSVDGEYFIVQYRAFLDDEHPWVTLASGMPNDAGTNRTTFVHEGIVFYPPSTGQGSTNGGGGPPDPSSASYQGGTQTLDSGDVELPLFPPLPWIDQEPTLEVASFNSETTSLHSESLTEGNLEGTLGFYRVVREGAYFFGLSEGALLSGIVTLPIEVGMDEGVLDSLTINADGDSIPSAIVSSNALLHALTATIDTRMLNNGVHYLQAKGVWRIPRNNSVESPFVSAGGPYLSINISNLISYPSWVGEASEDKMIIRVSTAQPSVDWEVKIFGEDENLVRTFTGHTDDGAVEVIWDLRNTNGILQTDSTFRSTTTITWSGGGGSNAANIATEQNPPVFRVVDNFPDQGQWSVSRLDMYPATWQRYGNWVGAINSIAQMGEQGGGVLPLPGPQRGFGEALTIQSVANSSGWSTLFFSLTNKSIRNFYFDGHGSPNGIGDRFGGLSASAIGGILGNNQMGTNTFFPNATRYRFVWMDGCETAKGGWPAAFGLGTRKNVPLESYTSRPGAFCGFREKTIDATGQIFEDGTIGGAGQIFQSAINFRSSFAFYWRLGNRPLWQAFRDAAQDAGYNQNYLLLEIYGYRELRWIEYNTKGEWPISP